jgi:hypothetical protein
MEMRRVWYLFRDKQRSKWNLPSQETDHTDMTLQSSGEMVLGKVGSIWIECKLGFLLQAMHINEFQVD